MAYPNSIVHQLINKERKKRGLPYVRWNQHMYHLAKSQADYCAKVGKLVHSDRYALQGGENLCGGTGKISPRQIVNCWMRSKQGHREWLLDPRVKEAGVGISHSRHGTYAAWAFKGDTMGLPNLTLPDPVIVIDKISQWFNKFKFSINRKADAYKAKQGRRGMLRIPISLFLGFLGLLGITLGAHGLYVYFSRLELLFGGEGEKLFLALEVPIRLQGAVIWASEKGVQSWFIPAAILVGGILIWNYSGASSLLSRALAKLKLW